MARNRVLEWDKEGDAVRQIRFNEELPSTVALTGTPTVEVQKLTLPETDPQDWNTETSISVSSISVVDAVDDDGSTVLGTNQAVQFQLDMDPAALPDETDAPIPGKNYRVVVKADRDDAGDVVGKVPLTIHP